MKVSKSLKLFIITFGIVLLIIVLGLILGGHGGKERDKVNIDSDAGINSREPQAKCGGAMEIFNSNFV